MPELELGFALALALTATVAVAPAAEGYAANPASAKASAVSEVRYVMRISSRAAVVSLPFP
ncbi:hypothetical protein GCM10009734_29590 [Nonomuraea bangladeshensis]